MRLAELGTAFSNNVLDATKAFALVLTDPRDVEGLPPSDKAASAQAYNQAAAAAAAATAAAAAAADATAAAEAAPTAGAALATAEGGPWRLGLDLPSYLSAMRFVRSAAVREALYRAYVTRAAGTNAPVVAEVLRLRRAQAELLGYGSHAEVRARLAPGCTFRRGSTTFAWVCAVDRATRSRLQG